MVIYVIINCLIYTPQRRKDAEFFFFVACPSEARGTSQNATRGFGLGKGRKDCA